MKNIAYWWIAFWAQLITLGVLGFLGTLTNIWANDVSSLSVVILILWFIGTIDVGIKTHQAHGGVNVVPRTGWFLSEAVTAFGMMGTLVGFIVMVDSSVIGVGDDVTTNELKAMLGQLTAGLKTAVFTTLIGLVAMVSLKFQLNNIDLLYDNQRKSPNSPMPQILQEG